MLRTILLRFAQTLLGLDGILHIAALSSAIWEQAWWTAGITSIQCLAFFLGVYFIGHDHSHHGKDNHRS